VCAALTAVTHGRKRKIRIDAHAAGVCSLMIGAKTFLLLLKGRTSSVKGSAGDLAPDSIETQRALMIADGPTIHELRRFVI